MRSLADALGRNLEEDGVGRHAVEQPSREQLAAVSRFEVLGGCGEYWTRLGESERHGQDGTVFVCLAFFCMRVCLLFTRTCSN